MKCISCEVQIDPKWKHAIDINVCPFCGQGIMEEKLKSLLSALTATMNGFEEYPDQLEDWLLSNFNYIKINSPNLKNYIPKEYVSEIMKERDVENFLKKKEEDHKKHIVKVQTEDGEEEVVTEKIQEDEKTIDFFKRADAGKPKIDGKVTTVAHKTKHLKDMVQQIKRGGAPVMNGSGMSDMISPEMMEQADPEAVAELQSILSGGESIVSSLPDTGSDDNGDDPPAFIVQALNAKAAKGQGQGGSNTADLLKHQKLYDGINKSKKNFNSGGGGFSRA
jgi:hypothetical protein